MWNGDISFSIECTQSHTNHIRLGCKHKVFKTLQCHPLDWQLCLLIRAAVVLSLKQLMRQTKVGYLNLVLVVDPAANATTFCFSSGTSVMLT